MEDSTSNHTQRTRYTHVHTRLYQIWTAAHIAYEALVPGMTPLLMGSLATLYRLLLTHELFVTVKSPKGLKLENACSFGQQAI